ncbi:MAG TPA: CHASE3 domain-containing protein, partial [Terracidiphilus sp.]
MALLLMGGVSYRWMIISDESNQWVQHTHMVLTNIQDLLLAMESIESSSREFVLTGQESDLEPYHAGVMRLEQ